MRPNLVHRFLLASAALALVGAAILVILLQRNSTRRRQAQTAEIVQQLCLQTGMRIRHELRDSFGAAVSDTIEGIGHPELLAFDLPRVAEYFESGHAHPYVDRFFIWSVRMDPRPQGEVVFYRRAGEPKEEGDIPIFGSEGKAYGALYSSPSLGRVIWSHALALSTLKRSFTVVEERVDGRPYQFMIHVVFGDDRRSDFKVVVGFTVDFTRVRKQLFRDMLQPVPLEIAQAKRLDAAITILDDTGEAVFGEIPPPNVPSASVPLEMLFLPISFRPFMATAPETPVWTLIVSAASPVVADIAGGYWLFGSVVFLILVGLLCAVTLDRQSVRFAERQSEFVAHVSHQLKTPLALLSGAAETLGRGRLASPEKIQEYAGIVHVQCARLSALVEQAIVFSVVDGKGTGLRFEVVDISGLVHDVVEAFSRGTPEELEVHFSADEGVPFVKADTLALEHVVWNLLENAVKYGGKDNSIRVSVGSNSREAVVTIRDRGQGIASDEMSHIFDSFYRSPRQARQRRGFGLGLAYVQKVVVAHGGRIRVNSELAVGSEFRVYLPAA